MSEKSAVCSPLWCSKPKQLKGPVRPKNKHLLSSEFCPMVTPFQCFPVENTERILRVNTERIKKQNTERILREYFSVFSSREYSEVVCPPLSFGNPGTACLRPRRLAIFAGGTVGNWTQSNNTLDPQPSFHIQGREKLQSSIWMLWFLFCFLHLNQWVRYCFARSLPSRTCTTAGKISLMVGQ